MDNGFLPSELLSYQDCICYCICTTPKPVLWCPFFQTYLRHHCENPSTKGGSISRGPDTNYFQHRLLHHKIPNTFPDRILLAHFSKSDSATIDFPLDDTPLLSSTPTRRTIYRDTYAKTRHRPLTCIRSPLWSFIHEFQQACILARTKIQRRETKCAPQRV